MTEEALARCPFCGGEAELKRMPSAVPHMHLRDFIVQCAQAVGGCPMNVYMRTPSFENPKAAIAAWNKRAAPSPSAEGMLRALEKAAAKFREYETYHRAKGTSECVLKAEVNNAMAELCEAAALSGKEQSHDPR